MTILTRTLNALGLMTRAEHEAAINAVSSSHNHWQAQARDWEAKFKKATTDLAAQSVKAADLAAEVESLRPDALAMRRKRQMDRDRRKGRG